MKAAYNQNDLGLYPLDNEFIHECENCIFLRSSYKCTLLDFGEDNFDELSKCWNAIFTPEPLSNIFEL